MLYRSLIAYSPYLLSVLVVFLVFTPVLMSADGTPETLEGTLFGFVVGFFGMLAGLMASLLDYAVNQFVINFGGNVVNSGVGFAINSLWAVVRDFFNIIFIFAIVYLGFRMILSSDESGTQRRLAYLILAALLVNFSLFISKFVVDFSNILAREVALSAFPAAQGGGQNVNTSVAEGSVDIGGNFFKYMNIPQTLNVDPNVPKGDNVPWGYIFGISMVYIIAIFVFAAGALMLMIRFAALCIFMILSPLMFIGWILPQYQNVMNKYWTGFLGRAFYAPVYIVLLYFSGAVIQATYGTESFNQGRTIGETFTQEGTNAVAVATGGFAAGLGPFIISAIFMIASIQAASKLSADGSGAAMRIGGNLVNGGRRGLRRAGVWTGRKTLQGGGAVTAGVAARVGRSTVGTTSHMLANSELGRKIGRSGWAGRQVFKAAQVGADSSFDIRQVGKLGKRYGLGEGKKGGVNKIIKDQKKADEQLAKDLHVDVDWDKEENIIQRDVNARSIASEAKGKYNKAAQKKTGAKERVDGINARKTLPIYTLVQQQNSQESELSALKETFEDAKESGATDRELKAIDEQITAQQKLITDTTELMAFLEKQAELAKKMAEAEKRKTHKDGAVRDQAHEEVDRLTHSMQTHTTEFDNHIYKELDVAEAQLEKIEKDYGIKKDHLTGGELNAKGADQIIKKATEKAAAQMEYESEIKVMQQIEREQRNWNRVALATAATALTSFGTPLAGIIAVGALSNAYNAKQAKKSLEREYGKDGMKKAAKDKRAKRIREREEANSDVASKPKEDKIDSDDT